MTAGELYDRTIAFLLGRKRAYQLTLGRNVPAAQIVLADLAVFCRARETCFHADPRMHAVAEGRREVWLRIQQHLNLAEHELYELYKGKQQ